MPRKLRKPAGRQARLDLNKSLEEIFTKRANLRQRYHSPPGSPVNCPALADANAALHASRDLLQALHLLQRDLIVCTLCPLGEGCETLQSLNERIGQAISEIGELYANGNH